MSKKPKHASKPIENADSLDIPDSQKEHYAKLGYKPYLSNGGKIKWLSYEQHVYEKIKYDNKKRLLSLRRFIPSGKSLFRAIRKLWRLSLRNWYLIVIIIIILLILIYYEAFVSLF